MTRVLLVEDHAELRQDLAVLLGADGFAVQAVGSCRAARLALAQPLRPEAVVIDIGLPDGDGFGLAEDARASGAGVVFVTARRAMDDRLRGLTIGDAYLTKPVDARELAATLRSVLRRLAPQAGLGKMQPQDSAVDTAGQALNAERCADIAGDEPTAANETLHAASPTRTATPSGADDSAAVSAKATASAWRLTRQCWALRCDALPAAELRLSANERTLLLALAGTAGEPVSRDAVAAAMGLGADWYDSHRLDVLLSRLRQRAQRAFGVALPVTTARGKGYALTAALWREGIDDAAPQQGA